ncbi:unnamed protein product [Linum tenue]|uniref:Uncharacterized protein n=1 Tax=Linum tenue TaxID=586396 RepID=A0AAV0PBX4_9ROSI|nr:unnamed protein product [Linum tenue]
MGDCYSIEPRQYPIRSIFPPCWGSTLALALAHHHNFSYMS